MKRKFKLFATVASLCLCLALMAFGVYAASSVTYTASGSVKFDLADVFVTYSSSMTATVANETQNAVTYSGKSYTGDSVKVPLETETYQNSFGETVLKKTGDKIVLVVEITNDGSEGINVKFTVTANADNTDGLKNKVVSYRNGTTDGQYVEASGYTVLAGKTAQCSLTIELADVEHNVSSTNYSIEAVAVKAQA